MDSNLQQAERNGCVILHHQTNLLIEALRKALQKRAPDIILQDLQADETPCGRPHLILLPIQQAKASAIEGLMQPFAKILAAHPGAPILAIVQDCGADVAEELIRRNVTGIITADSSIEMVIAALRFALAGGSVAPPALVRTLTAHQDPTQTLPALRTETVELTSKHDTTFTPREIEVLHRLRQGLQNKIIAYELGISESTVKVHLRNVMKKLHASNRTQVAFMLRRLPHLTTNGAASRDLTPQ